MPTRKPTSRRRRTPVRMVVEPHADDESRRAVSGRIDLFNVAATGLDEWHSVSIFLRDADDETVGGILGEIWGGWLHVTHLWVAAPLRRAGHGRALLRAAERFAVERGCTHVRLESYGFQAPDFYRKQGYEVFAVLDDCPPGHAQFFLKRRLVGARSGR
ncbi:MAG: GNAT family N-acetyltransferase [Thermodesulfobacteriota bacterium]